MAGPLAFWLAMVCAPFFVNAAQPAPWGDLSGWIGKYPTDDEGPRPRRLLQTRPIAVALHALLDPADLAFIGALHVESLIRKVDGMIVVEQCMPHDCGANRAIIAIDPDTARLFVGLRRWGPRRFETKWVGSENETTLPASILHDIQ